MCGVRLESHGSDPRRGIEQAIVPRFLNLKLKRTFPLKSLRLSPMQSCEVIRRSMNNTVQSQQAAKANAQSNQIVQSLPTANARTQTKQTLLVTQQLKQTQTTTQNAVLRPTVAISESALELSAGYGFSEIRSFFREIFSFR